MLAAQLCNRHPAFGLPQDREDLRSVYLLAFIRNLLVHLAEKILPLQPLNFGGITTRGNTITRRCAKVQSTEFWRPVGMPKNGRGLTSQSPWVALRYEKLICQLSARAYA